MYLRQLCITPGTGVLNPVSKGRNSFLWKQFVSLAFPHLTTYAREEINECLKGIIHPKMKIL